MLKKELIILSPQFKTESFALNTIPGRAGQPDSVSVREAIVDAIREQLSVLLGKDCG